MNSSASDKKTSKLTKTLKNKLEIYKKKIKKKLEIDKNLEIYQQNIEFLSMVDTKLNTVVFY